MSHLFRMTERDDPAVAEDDVCSLTRELVNVPVPLRLQA
jgi:hypothetical protein